MRSTNLRLEMMASHTDTELSVSRSSAFMILFPARCDVSHAGEEDGDLILQGFKVIVDGSKMKPPLLDHFITL